MNATGDKHEPEGELSVRRSSGGSEGYWSRVEGDGEQYHEEQISLRRKMSDISMTMMGIKDKLWRETITDMR